MSRQWKHISGAAGHPLQGHLGDERLVDAGAELRASEEAGQFWLLGWEPGTTGQVFHFRNHDPKAQFFSSLLVFSFF